MTDRNRSLAIRWFEEVWNIRSEAIIDQMIAPDAVGHLEGIDVVGPAEFKKVRAQLLASGRSTRPMRPQTLRTPHMPIPSAPRCALGPPPDDVSYG